MVLVEITTMALGWLFSPIFKQGNSDEAEIQNQSIVIIREIISGYTIVQKCILRRKSCFHSLKKNYYRINSPFMGVDFFEFSGTSAPNSMGFFLSLLASVDCGPSRTLFVRMKSAGTNSTWAI